MRPDKHTEHQKKFRKLWMEYEKLRDEPRGMYVEVEPYHHGWIRHRVLKDSAKGRPDADRLQEALKLVDVDQHSYNRDFTHKTHKGERMERPYTLKRLSEKQWEELPEHLQKYFVRTEHFNKYTHSIYYRYEFRYMNGLEFEYLDNIVTHHFIPDGPAESRLAELAHTLFRYNPALQNRVMGWSRYYRDTDKYGRVENILDKELTQEEY